MLRVFCGLFSRSRICLPAITRNIICSIDEKWKKNICFSIRNDDFKVVNRQWSHPFSIHFYRRFKKKNTDKISRKPKKQNRKRHSLKCQPNNFSYWNAITSNYVQKCRCIFPTSHEHFPPIFLTYSGKIIPIEKLIVYESDSLGQKYQRSSHSTERTYKAKRKTIVLLVFIFVLFFLIVVPWCVPFIIFFLNVLAAGFFFCLFLSLPFVLFVRDSSTTIFVTYSVIVCKACV